MPFNSSQSQIYTGAALASLEIPKGYFLLGPNLLPKGGRAVLGGLSGIGKSFIMMNMIQSFMDGSTPFSIPGWTAEKSRVLYVDMELGKYMFGDRLKEMFGVEKLEEYGTNFQVISQPIGLSLSNPEAVSWLGDYCDEQGIDVLFLDPISRMHYWGESSDSGQQVVESLARISREKTAIVTSHHFRKPATGRDAENYDAHSMYNFRGSVGTRLIEDASFVMTHDIHHIREADESRGIWRRWKLRTRMDKLRHTGNIIPEFDFLCNWENDRRVRFDDTRRLVKPLEDEIPPKKGHYDPSKGPSYSFD